MSEMIIMEILNSENFIIFFCNKKFELNTKNA